MNDESLRIAIEAKDNASATIKQVSDVWGSEVSRMRRDMDMFMNEQKTASVAVTDSLQKTSTASASAAALIKAAWIEITLIITSIIALTKVFTSSIDAINEYGTAMGKLEGTAIRFGQDVSEAKNAVMSLTQDGLINFSTAAEGLSRLMAQGLNMEDSVTLMERYKDVAALGRKETLSMDQAVLNLSQTFATEQSILGDNSGMWENYKDIIAVGSQALGKNTEELTYNERAQAKLLGTLIMTERASGDAARVAETYSGKLSQLSQLMFQLKLVIGSVVIPIVSEFINLLSSGLSSLNQWLGRIAPGLVDFGSRFAMAASEGLKGFDNLRESMGGAGRSAKDLAQQMQDAMRDYEQAVNRATDNFERSMIQIVQRHDERVIRIKQQIEDEQQAFSDYMSERTATFEDAMLKEEQRYAKRVEAINNQLKKEENDYEFRQKQLEDKFNERTEKEIKAYNDRVEKIKQQIRHETIFGGANARERIENYQLALAQEEASHKDRTASIESDLQKELAELKRRYNERTGELKARLKEENVEHKSRLDERQVQFEKETSKRKQELDKRTTANKNELSTLADFEKKHQAEFDKFRGRGVEDEIERTRRMYLDNLANMKDAHDKQLQSIKDLKNPIALAANDIGKDAGKGLVDGMLSEANLAFWQWVDGLLSTDKGKVFWKMMEVGAGIGHFSWGAISVGLGWKSADASKGLVQRFSQFIDAFPFASGGIVTRPTMGMIGEKGQPEAVIPLNRINDLLPKQQGGGDIVINVNGLIPFTAGQRRQVGELLLSELISAADANNISLEELGRK